MSKIKLNIYNSPKSVKSIQSNGKVFAGSTQSSFQYVNMNTRFCVSKVKIKRALWMFSTRTINN